MKWHYKSGLINLIILAIIILVCLYLTSCGPQKRLNKLIDNNPELVQNDTIRDTVFIQKVKKDTLVKLDHDTIYINKDRLRIKTVKVNDSIYIEGTCESDTIYTEIPVEKVIYLKDTPYTDFKKFVSKWWKWLLIAITLIVAGRIAKKFI